MMFHGRKIATNGGVYQRLFTLLRNPEKAETLPGAMVTAIVSAIVLLGVAAAMSVVMTLQGKSEAQAALQHSANNIETSLKSDSNLATRILPGADGKAVEFHFQPEDGTDQCRVATWQINGNSLVRTLRVFSETSGTGCNTSGSEITGSTKTLSSVLKDGNETTFKFFNDLDREIRMHGKTAVFAQPEAVCPLNQTTSGTCVIDNERTVDAWESSVVGKVGFDFSLTNDSGTVTRKITQNSVSSVYQAAQQAGGTGVTDTENIAQPGAPTVQAEGPVYLNANSSYSWTDDPNDGPVPPGYTKQYLVRVNGTDVGVQTGNTLNNVHTGYNTQMTVQVTKLYTRASITVTGIPRDFTIDTIPPTANRPSFIAPTSTVLGRSVPLSWGPATCTPNNIGATVTYEITANGNRIYSGTGRTFNGYTPSNSTTSTEFSLTAICNVGSMSFPGPSATRTVSHTLHLPNVSLTSTPAASKTDFQDRISAEATCEIGVPQYRVVNTTNNTASTWRTSLTNYNISVSTHNVEWKNAYNYVVEGRCVNINQVSDVQTSANMPVDFNSGTFTVVYNCPVSTKVYIPFDGFRGQVKYTGKTNSTIQTPSMDTSAFRTITAGGADTVVQYEGYFGRLVDSSHATQEQRDCIKSVTEWADEPNVNQSGGNSLFADMPNLTSVVKPPSTLTSMSGMFRNATSFNGDVSDWDTSNVMFMSSMFYGAVSFNQPVNMWDVSNVRGFGNMFFGASSFNSSVYGWDTSSATTMAYMFYGASAFNQTVNGFNTSNVTSMSAMFQNASSFNKAVRSWDTSKVKTMGSMFNGASSFNQSVNDWDTSSVTLMNNMFREASMFNQTMTNWNVSNVTNMDWMFLEAVRFNGLLTGWSTDSLTSMNGMFANASVFNRPVNHFNVSQVTSMGQGTFSINSAGTYTTAGGSEGGVFMGARAFNQPLTSWNVSNVTNMSAMFLGASAFNQNLSGWNVSKVTNMSGMFYGTNMSSSRPLGVWNVSNVTDMSAMFHGGYVTLGNVPRYESTIPPFNANISGWNVNKVTKYTLFGTNISSANKPAKFR